ncbi:ATP-binding protein [Micrococcus luteus]|nr:ATP-binding protein [Micrococcus luteus]MCV7508976.1 ATP-binding protein [Micrococcus luteus]MCV7715996.1 ATP-binding protein [Micrococcus luteus]
MKLIAVSLKNFRGYREEKWVSFEDLTTIVGRNDVGKSTILEALDIFFGGNVVKPDITDKNVSTSENFFQITCKFSELPPSLVLDAQAETSLAQEHLLDKDGCLQLRKRWVCTSSKPKEETYVVCQHPINKELDNLLSLTNTALKSLARTRLDPSEYNHVNKASNPDLRAALWGCEDLNLSESEISLGKEDGGKIFTKLTGYLPYFALFQSDRKSTDADDEVQEPMKMAITAALAEDSVQKLLEEVVEAVRGKATDLASRTHEALSEIDPAIAEGLVPEFKSDPRWHSLFSVALHGSNGVAINKRGSGVRRLILVSFFKAEAQRMLESSDKSSVIYALEEPETSQHPRNQKILLDSFQLMAEVPGTQVILTSHSPGFVSHLPAKSIRYIRKDIYSEEPSILQGNDDMWAELADELGVQPDNRVKVLICVEGPHDVTSLQKISRKLHEEDPGAYPDLMADHRFAFVPQGGGTLGQWVSKRYLKDLRRREFHLYDNDVSKYQQSVDAVNNRGDGSFATLTSKKMMENYLHPEAIFEALGVRVEVTDDCNVPKLVSDATKNAPDHRPIKEEIVKRRLADEAFEKMTLDRLKEADPAGDVKSWLQKLNEMATD